MQPKKVVKRTLRLGGRPLELRLSVRAARALAAWPRRLEIEMELYFSCLLRKRVNFRARAHPDAAAAAAVNDRVRVSFRPVMTRHCRIGEIVERPDVERFPLARRRPFTPRWLALDFRRGRWRGEFGFTP